MTIVETKVCGCEKGLDVFGNRGLGLINCFALITGYSEVGWVKIG